MEIKRIFNAASSFSKFWNTKLLWKWININGVYSKDNFPNKITDEAYTINLDEYLDIGTHWVVLYLKNNDITYFDSFGVEHIPKEILKFIGYKNIKTNIFRIQAYNSIICRYFVSDLLILCLMIKVSQNSQISFLLPILRKMMI